MAVGHLHRVAGLRRHGLGPLVDHLLVGLGGVDHREPQVFKEGPEEGHEFLEEHGPGDADGAAFAFLGRFFAVEPVFPLQEQVRQIVLLLDFPHFVFFASAAVEQGLFPFDLHLADFAAVGAAVAFKGSDLVVPVGQVEPLELGGLPVPFPHGQQRRADGPGDVVVGRHRDLLAAHLLKGGDDAPVGGGGPLVEDVVADGPVFRHLVEVVLDDGVRQAGHQVFFGRAPLLVVHQVGLHEHGAAFAQAHRVLASHGQVAELAPDGDPQFFGLLLQVGAGAGGADLVHHEVHDGAVGQADELGVLAADLENGVHLGVDGRGRSGLGGDFVPHHVGADEVAGEIAPRTGGGRAHDPDAVLLIWRPPGAGLQ